MDCSVVTENIKRIIEQKGLKQRIVADRSGFSKQQFCDMLHGRKVMRAEYVQEIAKALDVSVSELYDAGLSNK